jgi:predicted nucleic acid-binding Zn ribbon protein
VPDEQDGPDRARLAADALADAKADARARGERAPAAEFAAERKVRGAPAAPARHQPGARRPGGADGTSGAEGVDGASAPGGAATGGAATGGAATGGRERRAARAARQRREDPQPLGAAIEGLLDDQGWRTAAAVGSVFGRWEQIVGTALAAHTRPGGFTDGELLVIADSTAWATQVRLLRGQLIRRLNTELGDGTVTGVKVRGPAPPRQHGQWRVRDTRGPRDDYG